MANQNIIPFSAPNCLEKMDGLQPTSTVLLRVLQESDRYAREIIVRQWLTEGVPAAFSLCPPIYEALRAWLALRLSVHPKHITLLGSARLGYSLAPPPNFGRPFSENSDLDIAIVSETLFCRVTQEFQCFREDQYSLLISPRSNREKNLWEENVKFGERNIPRGFFDSNKIPLLDRYPTSQQIVQLMWLLCKKLYATSAAPRPKSASIRVYKDWSSLIDRVSFNLSRVNS